MQPLDLDLIVNSLHPAGGDFVSCMGYDALKVIAKKPAEPPKVTVLGCCVGYHDPGDIIRHQGFVGTGLGKGQPRLYKIKCEQQPVLDDEFIILCLVAILPNIRFLWEDGTGTCDRFACPGLRILSLKSAVV